MSRLAPLPPGNTSRFSKSADNIPYVRIRPWLASLAVAVLALLWVFTSPSRWAILIHGQLWAMTGGFNTVEWFMVGVALVAALALRRRAIRLPNVAGWRGVLLIGGIALAARAALLPLVPVPQPVVQDEFSFLLQADTFVHGRLTNPTHPMWVHLETMHVFFRPTYQSMYFPIQGIILAVGQLLGHPWIGQWLSGGVMCAAVCWMMQGCLPTGWAFLGSLLPLMRLNLFSYWINGYWGGMHAAIGGALALGGFARLRRRDSLRHTLLMALGMVILANSRPYEGGLLCIPLALQLVWKRRWRVVLPVSAVLALAGLAMGYYYWRVSGSPFRTPYQVNRIEYGWPATMAWLPAPPVPAGAYRHRELAQYHQWESLLRSQYFSPNHLPLTLAQKFNAVWFFFLGPAMTIPLAMLPWVLRDRRTRFLLAPAVLVLAGFGMAFLPAAVHYISPMTAAIYALEAQALRHLRVRLRRWTPRAGVPSIVWAVPTALFATIVVRALSLPVRMPDNAYSWCCLPPDGSPRAAIQRRLSRSEGPHLVIVRYGPNHLFHKEWVYNKADIDGAKVVWARDMGRKGNEELIRYFHDRQVWMVEPDQQPPRLLRYRDEPAETIRQLQR